MALATIDVTKDTKNLALSGVIVLTSSHQLKDADAPHTLLAIRNFAGAPQNGDEQGLVTAVINLAARHQVDVTELRVRRWSISVFFGSTVDASDAEQFADMVIKESSRRKQVQHA